MNLTLENTMSIWTYNNQTPSVNREAISQENCLYCNARLDVLPESYDEEREGREAITQVAACPICGWWKVLRLDVYGEYMDWINYDNEAFEFEGGKRDNQLSGAIGSLRELDLEDIKSPLEEVRNYLAAKYEDRFKVHPRLFEQTVASVFRDTGHKAIITAYSGDGGIDVILEGPNNTTIGVQVKRYKNSIKVEQIRSLAGALILGGHTKGVFVTTAGYQAGASKVAEQLAVRGFPIELVDAAKFYDALCLAQRNKYRSANERNTPFYALDVAKLKSL